MTRQLLIIFFVTFSLLRGQAKADEGMWLPFMIDDALYSEMQQMGLELTRDQIFSFSGSSLKDAIVHFGGGCTAEIISSQGLVLTNHHCGYGRIQAHSSVENDLLTNGFWANSLADELPNPGLFVRFLVKAEDVTESVLKDVQPGMDELQRNASIRGKINEIVDGATRGNHYSANIRPMFAGNEYFLFVYETFNDVRLVGTPPESVGAYGGDTDNWMWPRHTGDFSLFRVYTAPDGRPADYSLDNIPLKPKHYLPVSLKGVQENDFAMILGYPGNTNRYLTSYGIDYNLDQVFQTRIDIRRKKLDIIEEAMASSDDIRIKYASKQSGIANYWKNFIGMSRSLKRLDVAETKRGTERAFEQWVAQDQLRKQEYGSVMQDYRDAYLAYRQFHAQNFVFTEAMATGPDILRLANAFDRLRGLLQNKVKGDELDKEIENLRGLAQRTYRNYDEGVDRQLWAAMFEIYHQRIPSENLPEIYQHINQKYKNQFGQFADDVFKKSIFANERRLLHFLDKPALKVLQNDLAFKSARSVFSHYANFMPAIQQIDAKVQRTERLFLKGLREMSPDALFYPDANGTMRFTYGTVGGYHPADAVYYDFYTTLDGVMEKENPNHHEFVLPDKLKALYASKDYGRYGQDDKMIVNFISNNDITGGNSGSPVINGEGHLIGLAFDGNWEAMSGDILFEQIMQRCINVDARYILFVIDKYAGSTRLIDEMTIIY
jgi:hypothetical protein